MNFDLHCRPSARVAAILVFIVIIAGLTRVSSAQPTFSLKKTIPIGGVSRWDYLSVDPDARRLYIAHMDEVDVYDIVAEKVLAKIPAHGSHGVAVAHDLGFGYISNGATNSVSIFDIYSDKVVNEIKVGPKPDAILYDSISKRVFAFNGGGHSASSFDAKTGGYIKLLDLKGSPEFGVSDGRGNVYVNLEDKNEVLQIDAKSFKILNRWPIPGGDAPSGLAIDKVNHRLFIGCANLKMFVMDADHGSVINSFPIGKGVDATGFDWVSMNAFSSNGDGTLTVIHENSPSDFTATASVPTALGARTMAIDYRDHTVFVATADNDGTKNEKGRPNFKDDSFKILEYGE